MGEPLSSKMEGTVTPFRRDPPPEVVHIDDFTRLPTAHRVRFRWINVGEWWYGRPRVKDTVL